jgi:hypothetical protein
MTQLPATNDSPPAIAFIFYKFDKPLTADDTLRLLAAQLLEVYWQRHSDIPNDLYKKIQGINSGISKTLQEIIIILINRLKLVYLFLDGGDEDVFWVESAGPVRDFVLNLAESRPSADSAEEATVRVWYSSQERGFIKDKLHPYSLPVAQAELKADVALYLKSALPSLSDITASLQDSADLYQKLETRAEGNFLWASIMVNTLQEAWSPEDVANLIRDGMPESLDAYYKEIFKRFHKNQRSDVW